MLWAPPPPPLPDEQKARNRIVDVDLGDDGDDFPITHPAHPYNLLYPYSQFNMARKMTNEEDDDGDGGGD